MPSKIRTPMHTKLTGPTPKVSGGTATYPASNKLRGPAEKKKD